MALRRQFGEENWLSNQAGTFVQDIMGLQLSYSTLTPDSTTKNLDSTNSVLNAEDFAVHLNKNVQEKGEENSEHLAKENSETGNETKESTEISNGEYNISELPLTENIESALVNVSEPFYDPEEGTLRRC